MSRARELAGFATATNPVQDLNVGVVTAISFSGDGSSLTGIDATSIKDGDGTVRAQANTSGVVVTGILTATSLEGDGSALTGLPAGLGTAVAATGDGANIYFTNQVLDVASNLSIDVPATAVVAYTQYPEVAVASGIDITIADGDDFIADILGIGTTGAPQVLAGGGGRIRADNFTDRGGSNAPTFPNGVNVTGVATATTFVGGLTGNVTGNISGGTVAGSTGTFTGDLVGVAASFSGNVTVGGTLTYEDVTNVDSTGIVTAKGGVRIPNDTGTITMGTGSDLQLYHDGTNSYINNTLATGDLIIDSAQNFYIKHSGEKQIQAINDGTVILFYDNTEKFRTTTSGATITGAGICTSLIVGPGIIQEDYHSYGTALTGTYNHDVVTHGMVLDSTVAASASFVINLRGDGSTTFNSLMNIGQTTVLTVYSVSSNASYYLTDFQIDGSSITEKWNGAAAPSAGTGSGTDVYTFNIMKTASATFSVYANFSNFA
tara:strand:- start:799 stop:2268 length:1470 start_codon:yes stop_codon:yes gene_type:complete